MPADFQAVPCVDIAGLTSSDVAVRRGVAEAMGRAAREVGFLYITGHGLSDRLAADLRRAGEAFFAQPLATRMASYIGGSSNHSGYVPEGEEVFASGKVDKKEAYDVGLDWPEGAADEPMVGPNLWPPLPGFQAAAAAYYEAASALARRLFRGFALALDLPEDHFEPHLTRPPSQLRLVHYPFDPEAHDQEGIGAHTDYEFFTILFASAPGLEVKNGAGAWIDAPPLPGALVVNIGDMLEVWTNGAFTATTHRVRRVAEERYAFPFFATCDYWTVVEPHPRFVGPDHPPRFPRVVSGEHLFAQTRKTFRYLGRPGGSMTLEDLARTAPFARPIAVPAWTLGGFRRRSITFADGTEDQSTAVVWLQSHGLTGDIRIPADRPDVSHRDGLHACSREELIGLAAAEGGVAETAYADGLMSWSDWSAFQPRNAWPEPGDLRRVGDCMIEFAPSGAYVEDWRFLPSPSSLLVGLRLVGEQEGEGPLWPRMGGLVIAGDLAILSLGRRRGLPEQHLRDLLRAAADLHALVETAFDAVTSLGRRRIEGFEVELSTNPFLHGQRLQLGEFEPGAAPGTLLERLGTRRRIWRIDTLLV